MLTDCAFREFRQDRAEITFSAPWCVLRPQWKTWRLELESPEGSFTQCLAVCANYGLGACFLSLWASPFDLSVWASLGFHSAQWLNFKGKYPKRKRKSQEEAIFPFLISPWKSCSIICVMLYFLEKSETCPVSSRRKQGWEEASPLHREWQDSGRAWGTRNIVLTFWENAICSNEETNMQSS